MPDSNVLMPRSWWLEIAALVRELAEAEREDVIGLFIKRGVFHRLNEDEQMALARLVEFAK